MEDFSKSLEILEEAIIVFNQLPLLLAQHGFQLKKWISKNDADTEAIPENLKSISDTKQEEIEPNRNRLSVLGLQWFVTDDYLQMCRGTKKDVEAPTTPRKVILLLSSAFELIGLLASRRVLMSRLPKFIWTMGSLVTKNILRWKK